MKDLDIVFGALANSAFRRRFQLLPAEADYLRDRGLDTVMDHARDLIERRLAPAAPRNDGRQTPWRGHPVFVAQHATACCCRSCLEKWHAIPRGRELSEEELAHVLRALRRWLQAASSA
ncbi:MAG: DUF4186 domain-containing protein [Ramlibacter sp.]